MYRFLILLFFLITPITVYALDSCVETKTLPTKIYDKSLSLYDTFVPILLHDPQLSIQFHLTRSKIQYSLAKQYIDTNPARAVNMALRGQHHITLLESNIRKFSNLHTVPFDSIFSQMHEISILREKLFTESPHPCISSFQMLSSFHERSEASIKKLYIESLLP